MCDYCENMKIMQSCNFGGVGKARIIGQFMDVFGDKKKFRLFEKTYQPSFWIDYCPMCGKS